MSTHATGGLPAGRVKLSIVGAAGRVFMLLFLG